MAFAWPMWRYPLGSGGKRVCTRPSCLPALMSWIMMSRMKLDRPPDSVEISVEDSAGDSTGAAPALDSNKFICLYDLPYKHIEAEGPIGHISVVNYKSESARSVLLEIGYRADLIVEDKVIIEIKSIEAIAPVHYKQVLTYLKVADKRLGLLINFNVELIKDGIKRLVNGLDGEGDRA